MNRTYLRLGDFEIANNLRVADYADSHGVHWFYDCDACEAFRTVLYAEDGYPYYRSPKDDPAPWYREGNPDSASFLGSALMDVKGDVDHPREAKVVEKLRYGTFTAPSYTGGREMVFRLLLVALDEPGLNYGFGWFRTMSDLGVDGCTGARLHYFAACSPICVHTEDEAAACVRTCVKPYARHFNDVRIIDGFTVLSRREMPSGGWYAECELVLHANDPRAYTGAVPLVDLTVTGGEPMKDSPPADEVFDPFEPVREPRPMREKKYRPVPTNWYRTTWDLPVVENVDGIYDLLDPEISVSSEQGSREVRLTLLSGRMPVASWVIPRIPAGGTVRLQPAREGVHTAHSGVSTARPGYVYAPTGGPAVWPSLEYDDYVLAVDQALPGTLEISVAAGTVG